VGMLDPPASLSQASSVSRGVEEAHGSASLSKEVLRQSASTEYSAHRLAVAFVRPAGRLKPSIARPVPPCRATEATVVPSANNHGGKSLSWALVPSCRVLDWSPRHALARA
jgi:hypothetical protein